MKNEFGKFIYELIGTFFLMLTVGMTVGPDGAGPLAPIAIGAVLAALVYAGGHVSGGHYNPMVSLTMYFRKKLNINLFLGYVVAQLIGAVAAAFTVMYLKKDLMSETLQLDPWRALLAEFLFTFILCFVAINVTTGKKSAGNSYYGIAIGLIVLVGVYAVGVISGAVFNPAVALGISILKLSYWSNLWVYLVAGSLGAGVAAIISEDCE